MTDELPQPEPAAAVATAVQPDPAAGYGPVPPVPFVPPVPSGRKPGKGRWVALGGALILSAVVVGGGVGYGVLALVGKPKPRATAAKPAPVKAPNYGALSNGNHFGSLSDLLLPIPAGLSAGSDDGNFGNDAVLTGAQFRSFFDRSIRSFSTAERRSADAKFDAMHVKGYALRTYMVSDTTEIEVSLRQENQKVAVSDAGNLTAEARKTGLYRPGPGVPGFPSAHCYLPPLLTGDKLDYLLCDASVGDIYVNVSVEGVAPLDTASAVSLLSQQLTRLAIPGAQT